MNWSHASIKALVVIGAIHGLRVFARGKHTSADPPFSLAS